MSLDLPNDNSILVQIMAWCRQATNHYLSLCWPRSMSPYGVTKPLWVLTYSSYPTSLDTIQWHIHGIVQDRDDCIVGALELPQPCAKPSNVARGQYVKHPRIFYYQHTKIVSHIYLWMRHRWHGCSGPGNSLVLLGNKPIPRPFSTQYTAVTALLMHWNCHRWVGVGWVMLSPQLHIIHLV